MVKTAVGDNLTLDEITVGSRVNLGNAALVEFQGQHEFKVTFVFPNRPSVEKCELQINGQVSARADLNEAMRPFLGSPPESVRVAVRAPHKVVDRCIVVSLPDYPVQQDVSAKKATRGTSVDVTVGSRAALAAQNLNLLLEGVPGTGKTFAFDAICKGLGIDDPKRRFVLNCHPSTQYEDVIEGLRPKAVKNEKPWQPVDGSTWKDDPDQAWHVVDGVFLRACTAAREARKEYEKDPLDAERKPKPVPYVAILLDELNRANVPRMLGDLLTVMERSKRVNFGADGKLAATPSHTVTLPVSGRTFLVPDNLIIVATMNSVDHSVAPLDQALLRRFWRVRVEPMNDKHAIAAALERKDDSDKRSDKDMWAALSDPMKEAVDAFVALNETIGAKDCLGPDGMIGQSFLFDMHVLSSQGQTDAIEHVWRYGVAPQVIAALQAAGKEAWFDTDKGEVGSLKQILKVRCKLEFEISGSGSSRNLRLKAP